MIHKVPCGQCMACRITRVVTWSERIKHEWLQHDEGIFLTLTYGTEKQSIQNAECIDLCSEDPDTIEELREAYTLDHSHVQLFIKKLRSQLARANKRRQGSPAGVKSGKKSIRYFCAGEYGTKFERPHYHFIMFGVSKKDVALINKCWDRGFIYVGNINSTTIRYVCGYIIEKLTGKQGQYYEAMGIRPPYCAVSRSIGLDYARKFFKNWLDIRKPINKYYKNKLAIDKQILYNPIRKEVERKLSRLEVDADNKQREMDLVKKISLRQKKL